MKSEGDRFFGKEKISFLVKRIVNHYPAMLRIVQFRSAYISQRIHTSASVKCFNMYWDILAAPFQYFKCLAMCFNRFLQIHCSVGKQYWVGSIAL